MSTKQTSGQRSDLRALTFIMSPLGADLVRSWSPGRSIGPVHDHQKADATSRAAHFQTTLHQTEGANTTGIIVPAEVIEELGHGKKPSVRVTINGYEYRSTVAVMGGQFMISVSSAIRKETGLGAYDPIDVVLTVDTTPREVEVPTDFAAALGAQPTAQTFFASLSNSLQRYHVDNINSAKTADTRQRRIDKAIGLFLDNKPR